jgi:hypothetical protein
VWPAFSPEENHTTLKSGAGSAATLAQAQTLTAHAEHLQEVVAASTVNAAGSYGAAWSGTGATAAQAAHTQVNTALAALAEWVAEKPPIITAAAQAYHTAVSEMVRAEEAETNRTQEAADVEVNPRVLGALTPQIAALNLGYFGYMWPTNAGAGASYGAVLHASMAALSTPPPPAPPAASPQAAAAADDDAMAASGQAMRQTRQPVREPLSRAAAVQPPASAVQAPPSRLAEMRPPAAAAPQPPPVGMYQRPPPIAAVNGPPAPAGGAPAPVPAPQASAVAAARPGGYPGAGLTRYLRPAEAFAMPGPPSGHSEILNAAALQPQPVTPPSPTQMAPMQPPPQPVSPPPAQSAPPAPVAPEPGPPTPPPPQAGTGSSRPAATLNPAQHRQPHTAGRATATQPGCWRCAAAGLRPTRARTTSSR